MINKRNTQIVEFSESDFEVLNTYWANFKIKHPKVYKILGESETNGNVTIKIIKPKFTK